MEIHNIISKIEVSLIATFSELETWFNKSEELRSFQPNKGWTVNQILEHIALTNHYLLILIDKGSRKAFEKAKVADIENELKYYSFNWESIGAISDYKSFQWERPNHMEPRGDVNLGEVRSLLKYQLRRCLGHLHSLSKGEGILHKTMMSVNGIGRIDVYEYVYFLAQHIQRHLVQLKNIESEFKEEVVKF